MSPDNVQIECRNIEMLPEWRTRILDEFERLQRHCGQTILQARAEIIGTRHHKHGAYEVRLVVGVAGETFVVSRVGDLEYPMLTETFAALQRCMEEHARRIRGEVKTHKRGARTGKVLRLRRMECFGFIEPDEPESLDVYFHANSVKKGDFFALEPGDQVSYAVEEGDKGPQAVWVRPQVV